MSECGCAYSCRCWWRWLQLAGRSLKYVLRREGKSAEVTSMGFTISLPAEGSIFDYMFDFDQMR